jgi:hypothetical protein
MDGREETTIGCGGDSLDSFFYHYLVSLPLERRFGTWNLAWYLRSIEAQL